VVRALWDSWEDDAFLRNKTSGRFFDPDKRHVLDHKGRFFQVKGPLNVARSPQGQPVLVQAGSSESGRALAARTAEVIFTAQQTLQDAIDFYADVKGRLAAHGRHPDDLKIMPGVFPIVGRTRSEAHEKFEELQSLIDPVVGLALVSGLTGGIDLSGYPLDGPIPELPETNASKSRQALTIELARRENLTIRQLYLRVAGARGHWQLVGTAEDIADQLEERFVNYGADGYNVMPPTLPGGLTDFIELVLPELRRRGLFRSDYEGHTLRENLGLRRPVNHHETERQGALAI
jgi:N-acetyl-S-(2-succino)cysteine monooxygenase